ncbi:hypothetical protein [Curtobacterium sp. PhB136]|uniref:hypothetical protein n=1 Tax=Curtobacterium sp. PhB136 TaxID=2485181 RepID=UPI0010517FC8|nr:hypothetical protein [Curtobacterium sp. PhB136]TCK59268.1 hypothetical protein EDF27_3791 [Curtobacterium sp. PhB136]
MAEVEFPEALEGARHDDAPATAGRLIRSTFTMLAVTEARVVYTSNRRSWTADLRQMATV